jgi:hypothetical protein
VLLTIVNAWEITPVISSSRRTRREPAKKAFWRSWHKTCSIVHMHTAGPLLAANGIEMDCNCLLECIGWKDPGRRVLTALFPQFTHRNFIFLNKSPQIVFVCDPHYSYPSNVKLPSQERQHYKALWETVPIGGTFSILILACKSPGHI